MSKEIERIWVVIHCHNPKSCSLWPSRTGSPTAASMRSGVAEGSRAMSGSLRVNTAP